MPPKDIDHLQVTIALKMRGLRGVARLGCTVIAFTWFCAGGVRANDQMGLPAALKRPATADRALAALGEKLFFDKRLSGDGSISCASCHQPAKAFSDGRALAQGIGGGSGTRNTPSLLNAAFNKSQFWDGRRDTLEAQAKDPFVNPREHGLADAQGLLVLLRNDAAYLKAFQTILELRSGQIQMEHVSAALATFERSLVSAGSPFDRYYFGGDKASLSPAAVRGLALFQGAAKCASCHVIDRKHALFSDNQFHSLSVGLQNIAPRLPALTIRLARQQAQGNVLDQTVLSDQDIAELGRFAVTLEPADIGKFRTPSLRNAALTAPYMHDGSVASLEQAVELEIYYRSAEAGIPLILTPIEKTDLVEFLKALTSPSATTFMPAGGVP